MTQRKQDDSIELLPSGDTPTLYNEETDKEPKYHLEDVIQSLGGCGRYQIRLVVIVQFMKGISCWGMFSLVFTNAIPPWTCEDDITDESNITWHRNCTNKQGLPCSKFRFDTSEMRTIVSEWSLICNKEWVPYTISSIQLIGFLFGSVFSGMLSDFAGRKTPAYLSLLLLVIGNSAAYACKSWLALTVARIFIGLGVGFFLSVCSVLIGEVTTSKWRALTFAIPAWPLAECLFSLASWLVPDWALLHLITVILAVPFFASWCFVLESIRWYIVHDKLEKADAVIEELARINGHHYPSYAMVQSVMERQKENAEAAASEKNSTPIDLFRYKDLRTVTICVMLQWFSLGLAQYGILFAISTMSGKLFHNMSLFSVIPMVCQVVASILCNRIGRRVTCVLCFALICVCSFAAAICRLTDARTTSNVFAMLAYAAVQALWISLTIITLELYPTVVRNTACGFHNMINRLAGIIAPQLSLLEQQTPGVMYCICGGISFLSLMASYKIPETKDVLLRDHHSDEIKPELSQKGSK